MSFECVYKGPYTVVHHQYYQMVDLLIQHWRRTMGGLNPYALPHVPPTPKSDAERTSNKMNNKKNAESTKWHARKTKKGRGCKNNNNKKKEKKTRLFTNRFSRLAEMVEDEHEITDVLETAVDEEGNSNMIKKKTTRNACNVDSADMTLLDAETQKHVNQDYDEIIQNNINLNENVDENENADNSANNASTSNKTESNEESEYDSEKERLECYLMHPDSDSERNEDSECDSERERLEYRLMHPDSDSACSDSDESVASNFELWNNDRVRCILDAYSE